MEDDFKRKNRGSISMKFKDFADLYLSDMENRLKPTTMQNKRGRFKIHLIPFFGEIPLNEITVIDVRKWQNLQQTSGLAQSTIRKNHTVLSTLFNYSVRYYGLHENPYQRAGTIGSLKLTKFEIWTLEEYQEFIQYIDNPAFKVAFDTLFYIGFRIGELTALTPANFDFSVPKLTVNKIYVVVGKDSYIYEPKTAKSNRDMILPRKVAEEIKEFIQIADYGGLKIQTEYLLIIRRVTEIRFGKSARSII